MLNQRARNLSPSPTMAMDAAAKALASQGVDVINLSAGEPDFDTPDSAKAGGRAAIDENFTKYTAAAGTLELRTAIAEKLRNENGVDYSADEIVVSNGAKQSLFNAFMVLLEAGDQVIIQAPYWVSYPEMVKISGGEPVIVRTDESTGFELQAETIERAVTAKTKAIVLSNPSNPTGVVYGIDKLRAIGQAAARHDLFIISDEIYERLTYDGAQAHSMAALGPQLRQRTITINGFSKAFSMTGWRLGYSACSLPLAKAMADLQSHCTSGASSITQKAGLSALRGDRHSLQRMLEQFDERRCYAVERVRALPFFELPITPRGAFYVFPRVRELFGKTIGDRHVSSSDDLCMALLDLARVAIVPGGAFGSPDHVRISYAASLDSLREAFDRIEKLLNAPQPRSLPPLETPASA
jgi:aspartate aminotransferase